MSSMEPDAAPPEWHRVRADERAAGAARRHVTTWLREHDADDASVSDLSLAASELASNVVQHGFASELYVRIHDGDMQHWTLEVVGGRLPLPTRFADPEAWTVAGADSPQGRGLGIVRTVVDQVEIWSEPAGLAIRCRRRRR